MSVSLVLLTLLRTLCDELVAGLSLTVSYIEC